MIRNKKQIIFFDGDGTLWYPKKTRRMVKPHWIYAEKRSLNSYCKQLVLIPTVVSTLKELKRRGIITVILSTHPQPAKEAAKIINHKAKYFEVDQFFDEIYATRHYHESKGEHILRVLKKRGIPKSHALMVGDAYHWDYKSAKNVGVDAVLIDSDYIKKDSYGKRVKNRIKKLSDVLRFT